jgi:hypothetical protein
MVWGAGVGAAYGDQPQDPYRSPPPPPPAPHAALAAQPWRVSTLTRSLGMQLFIGCFAALAVGAMIHGGDPNQEGGGAASDALFSPLALLLALGVAAIVLAVNYSNAGVLEGGGDWLRRVTPAPPVQIGMSEIVHVSRTRGLKVRNRNTGAVREARTLSFKVTAADGRSISVPEAAVFRQPRLLQFYDAAMETAFAAVGQQLAAGTPLVSGDVSLYVDQLVFGNGARIPLRDIAAIQVVVGESAVVRVIDRSGRQVVNLPDDQLLLSALGALGVRIDEQTAPG